MNEKTLFGLILIVGLTACDRGADPASEPPKAESHQNEDAPAKEESPAEPEREAEPPRRPAEPKPLVGPEVDVCPLLAKEDAERVLGPLTHDPTPMRPSGSLLGGCTYFGEQLSARVVARPAREFEEVHATATSERKGKRVRRLGKSAVSTELGILIQLESKDHFLVVLAGPQGKMDPKVAEPLARKLKL